MGASQALSLADAEPGAPVPGRLDTLEYQGSTHQTLLYHADGITFNEHLPGDGNYGILFLDPGSGPAQPSPLSTSELLGLWSRCLDTFCAERCSCKFDILPGGQMSNLLAQLSARKVSNTRRARFKGMTRHPAPGLVLMTTFVSVGEHYTALQDLGLNLRVYTWCNPNFQGSQGHAHGNHKPIIVSSQTAPPPSTWLGPKGI